LPIEPAEYRNGIRCPTGFSIHGMMAFIDSVWGTGRWEYRYYEQTGTARMVSWDGTTAVVEVPIEPTSVSGQFICRFGSGREVESIVWRWPR
jgi:hypothetical protein